MFKALKSQKWIVFFFFFFQMSIFSTKCVQFFFKNREDFNINDYKGKMT
jgi:hypothetical protein